MDPKPPDDEPTSGVPSVDEDDDADELLDESAGLLVWVTAWVACGDELTLGAVLGLAETVPVTVAAGVVTVDSAVVVLVDGDGVELVHRAIGGGPDVLGFALGRELLLGLELAVLGSAGLTLAELGSVGLTLAVLVSVGLTFPLSEGLALVLAGLLVPVWLDEVAGPLDVADPVAWADVLALLDVLALVDAEALAAWQSVGLELAWMPAIPDGFTVGDSGEAEPAVEPGPLVEPEPLMSALICDPMVATSCRVVGTTARTTPSTNTAMPVAKAGRSIASRQSRRLPGPDEAGPDEAGPDEAGPNEPRRNVPRAGSRCRIQSVTGPANPGHRVAKSRTASHTAIAP